MAASSPGPAIAARGLSKYYRRFGRRKQFQTLKSAFLSASVLAAVRPEDAIVALDDVSFEVAPGESMGVIGANGSGKSTLLKLASGILKPNRGSLEVSGRVSALIELGAGFHPEISGRENVFVNGIMLGLTRKQVEDRYADIVRFAGLEGRMDEAVKSYSSGMYVRLGFAVAIHADPRILLIDEVLAVGDEAFTHKCLAKIRELKSRGVTILLVSHALEQVGMICDRILWLRAGKVAALGPSRAVIDAYLEEVARGEGQEFGQSKLAPELARWGNREAEITAVELVSPGAATASHGIATGHEITALVSGAGLIVRIHCRAARPQTDFVFGIGVFNAAGIACFGTNTDIEGYEPAELSGEAVVELEIPRLELADGAYRLDVALHRRDGTALDYGRGILSFQVLAPVHQVGVYNPRRRWHFSGGVRWRGSPALSAEFERNADS